MPGALLWGYYLTTKTWIPLQVDENGYVKVDMSSINLDDLGDVSVVSPADDDLFYYDDATSLWKSRKLADADIPAGIARDAEVAAAVAAEATARIADVDAEEVARIAADAAHAILTTGIHGAGSNYIAHTGLFTPIAGQTLKQSALLSAPSPFTAKINGAPSSTSVVYDTDTNEGSVNGIYSGADYWGRIILHNTTRGNSRKIVSVNVATNTITTEDTSDDWADDDDITTQSQIVTEAGYFDIDLSAELPAEAKFVSLFVLYQELVGAADDASRTLLYHPYEAYDVGKRLYVFSSLKLEASTAWWVVPVVSQKITLFYRNTSTSMQAILLAKGYM